MGHSPAESLARGVFVERTSRSWGGLGMMFSVVATVRVSEILVQATEEGTALPEESMVGGRDSIELVGRDRREEPNREAAGE